LRITFLLTQSLESPSGLGRYWPLSKELARLGHDVTILALHHDLASLKQRFTIIDGVRVHYVGQMHVLKKGNTKFYFGTPRLLWITALATWNLMKAAIQIPTDVYHICKPHPMNGIAAVVAHSLRGKPIYLDCDDYEAVSNRFGGEWQRYPVAFFEDKLPTMAKGITVNTRFTFERLRKLGYPIGRIVYVPNGVDRERFSNADKMAVSVLRQQYGLDERKIILYIGSLSLTSHAVDLLIEAFKIVQKLIPQAVLLLIGGGEDYNALYEQVKDMGLDNNVCFIGRVPPSQVPIYYFLADVSVDPVYNDMVAMARSPLKIVESLACGVPVVTGNVGDRAELLAHGGGVLVPPGDPDALAKALALLLTDKVLQARLSREALMAREKYWWDTLVHDFVQVYGDNN